MSLDNSECEVSEGGGPLFRPLGGVDPLHRHQEEAARQHLLAPDQARLAWDLLLALWGRMEDQVGSLVYAVSS